MTAGTPAQRLAACTNLSGAESAVAHWLEANLADAPFIAAAEVAAGAGVSEMTVMRFMRRLGYDNFKAFKAALREDRPTDGPLRKRVAIPRTTPDQLAQQLKLELDAIVEVYELAQTDKWLAALDVIETAQNVKVTGFQGSMGLAMDFATRMKYARPGVRFAAGTSGNWSEIFAENVERSCVILVDTLPYAREAIQVCELCLRRDIPLVTITDRYDPWPRRYTPHALSVSTVTETFLDSTSGLSALLGLMLNGITARAGEAAQQRLREMSALGDHFGAYSFDPGSQSRPVQDTSGKRTDP